MTEQATAGRLHVLISAAGCYVCHLACITKDSYGFHISKSVFYQSVIKIRV